jgi:hypothetical protein
LNRYGLETYSVPSFFVLIPSIEVSIIIINSFILFALYLF